MQYFQYPLDTKILLRKKRSIKRKLLENKKDWIIKRIAVLGGSTTNEVVEQLELFLLYYGIKAEFYQSEYGQYWEDAMFNDKLEQFMPDIIYIHTNWRNIKEFPLISDTNEIIENKLKIEYERFQLMWIQIHKKFNCPIIQNNFDRPDYRVLGNRDIWDMHGKSQFIFKLNQKLYEYAQNHDSFYINDLDYLASDYGLSKWNDANYWYMYKYAMCLDAIPYLAKSIADIIKSLYGKNKKVLVLDLDNTLWGGIIGEDGIENIVIGNEIPKGQAYLEFQSYCKALKQIGIILAINSKNDIQNAVLGLNHPNNILKEEDFVMIEANWNPKDQNIKEIVDYLTLSLDSCVFIDDSLVEQELIRLNLPEVSVPKVQQIEQFIPILDHSGYFEVTHFSGEDINKTQLYHKKIEAKKMEIQFTNYDEYLDSLNMKATIKPFETIYLSRITQLINKTNQFNLTTIRYTEEEIKKISEDDNMVSIYGRLQDKFGDNGIVTIVIGEQKAKELHIHLWLMSCRVLKRSLEDAMMDYLIQEAKSRKINKVIGYYRKTAKNGIVENFYSSKGFEIINKDENQIIYQLETGIYNNKNKHILIER